MADKLTVKVESFRPLRKGSLLGFADLLIVEMGLRIREASIHQSYGRRWVGLPAKPQIDREGRLRHDDRGKTAYVNILQFTDKATSDGFSERAIAALLEAYPRAFDELETAS